MGLLRAMPGNMLTLRRAANKRLPGRHLTLWVTYWNACHAMKILAREYSEFSR
jgi:hypothetical protein